MPAPLLRRHLRTAADIMDPPTSPSLAPRLARDIIWIPSEALLLSFRRPVDVCMTVDDWVRILSPKGQPLIYGPDQPPMPVGLAKKRKLDEKLPAEALPAAHRLLIALGQRLRDLHSERDKAD